MESGSIFIRFKAVCQFDHSEGIAYTEMMSAIPFGKIFASAILETRG